MASAQTHSPQRPAADPLAAGAAPSRWPVLARIAEVGRRGEPIPAEPVESTYRVDAPHAAAPTPTHMAPPTAPPCEPARPLQPSGTPTSLPLAAPPTITKSPDPTSPNSALAAAPLPIRVAVETWQAIQPYRELIRLAAMLALMVAGGMSMGVMMHSHFKSLDKEPAPITSTAHQTTGTEPKSPHAELEPVLEPAAPETNTSALEPTAEGPLSTVSQPVMAVEPKEEAAVEPPAAPYPTTSYSEVHLPTAVDDCSLPQVRTTEPEVAHLRGDLLKTQTR